MFRIRSRHHQGQKMRQTMTCTTTVESTTCTSLQPSWATHTDFSDTTHSRYTCSKFRFGWSRSKVTLHEEQSTYSPLILMLSDVFSPKFTSVTPRIFFIHALSFLVIGQEKWALHMTTKVVLRPFSFPATGIFMKIHT